MIFPLFTLVFPMIFPFESPMALHGSHGSHGFATPSKTFASPGPRPGLECARRRRELRRPGAVAVPGVLDNGNERLQRQNGIYDIYIYIILINCIIYIDYMDNYTYIIWIWIIYICITSLSKHTDLRWGDVDDFLVYCGSYC